MKVIVRNSIVKSNVKVILVVVGALMVSSTSTTLSVLAQRDICSTQDSALDACLDTLGATDGQKASCDQCITSIATNTLVKGAIGTFCETSNTAACAELLDCPCLDCSVQAVFKGECEVVDERSTSGSNCNEDTWGGPLTCPSDTTPTDAPGTYC